MTTYSFYCNVEIVKKSGVTRQKLADTMAQALLQLDVRAVDIKGGQGAKVYVVKPEGK